MPLKNLSKLQYQTKSGTKYNLEPFALNGSEVLAWLRPPTHFHSI